MRLSNKSYTIFDRILQMIVVVYQALAVVAFCAGIFLGLGWMRSPFLGAFYEHTMLINGSQPSGSAVDWDLLNQGVRQGDQLISVNGIILRSTDEVLAVLSGRIRGTIPTERGFVPGETIPIEVRNPAGVVSPMNVTLHVFPSADRTAFFFIPMFISLVFLGVSLWIFGFRRAEPAGRAFSLFASSLAILTGSLFDLFTTHYFTHLWTVALGIAGGALINLALVFPQEPRVLIGRPYLRWVGILIGLSLSGWALTTLFNFEQPAAYIQAWRNLYIFVGLSAIFYLSTNIYYGITAYSPVVKTQSRTIVGGALIGFGPMIIWLMTTPIRLFEFTPYLFLTIVIFPLTVGYTILRFRLVRADEWFARGLAYTILTFAAIAGYALVVFGASLIFTSRLPANHPIWIGAFVFLIAIALDPVRTRLQELVDVTFFRGQRAYTEKLQTFSHELTSILDLNGIGRILRIEVDSALTPDRIHIYTYDHVNEQYRALPSEDGRPSSDIRFSSNSPLARYFQTERLPLYLDGVSFPASLETERSRLAILGARLFIVLPGKSGTAGWLALGARLSGQPYTPRDLSFLDSLCDQASLAIERVQTIANLEQRIQEMNALTRVSQGVNVTLTFDDVLELIFAQTLQVLPASEFHITLNNRSSGTFYYAFCVENNERLVNRENVTLPTGSGLSPEVIGKSRPILASDYGMECHSLGIKPLSEGVLAWAGVPLIAGAETIGALSVGSRAIGMTFTNAQLELLQAIANQTAGAIVKARLLEETQQRAHQLSTLNEITRQLTSTLELEPLLQNILQNAVKILNCEAGALYLLDEQTDKLVFKVIVGPLAADLLGQSLPADAGAAWRVITERQPVIENDVQRSPFWFDLDKQSGFESRALLAVPLQSKDRILGVLEVINRRDGLPFVEEDQSLLLAFASQGAVAIENARLYTMTDQALASRVEELSVMQRIDRELNASLEMERAMRITLDWALRQSQAMAGLIGMLADDKLRVVAHQGYDEQLAGLPGQMLKLELPALKAAVENGLPQRTSLLQPGEGLNPGATSQVVIPIRREAQVIGLLLLESVVESQVDLGFLTRLSDHAAIAISNAQLYGEVQRANLAKSDFVSFVAHELKNPMTAIKGYTELLAGGAVGQINDMQSNFLNTIRSNVDRMSTLVSDLNDDSKIEADRLRLEFASQNMPGIMDEIVRSANRQIDEKKQALNLALPEQLPQVWADRTRLAQVLVNLISNANKYTPEGGHIEIAAEATTNQWDPAGAPRVVHVWVRDDGIGISLEDQQKIFQKFFRSEDSKAHEVPGTGLGLNITKSLVEMQGGRIWFESEYRRGTTFHFTVPVAET